jgi:hypothetical protein
LWKVIKKKRKKIVKLLNDGQIADREEREKLDYLIKTKR